MKNKNNFSLMQEILQRKKENIEQSMVREEEENIVFIDLENSDIIEQML